MNKLGFEKEDCPEDDECWDIAESMLEEIQLITGKGIGELSGLGKLKSNFKRNLMRRVRQARNI